MQRDFQKWIDATPIPVNGVATVVHFSSTSTGPPRETTSNESTTSIDNMSQHSKHQQNIIRNYYDNRDSISLQRAQELVTELYLSEGKGRQRHWKHLTGHLEKLGVAPTTIVHLQEKDDPELVANLLTKISKKQDSA